MSLVTASTFLRSRFPHLGEVNAALLALAITAAACVDERYAVAILRAVLIHAEDIHAEDIGRRKP